MRPPPRYPLPASVRRWPECRAAIPCARSPYRASVSTRSHQRAQAVRAQLTQRQKFPRAAPLQTRRHARLIVAHRDRHRGHAVRQRLQCRIHAGMRNRQRCPGQQFQLRSEGHHDRVAREFADPVPPRRHRPARSPHPHRVRDRPPRWRGTRVPSDSAASPSKRRSAGARSAAPRETGMAGAHGHRGRVRCTRSSRASPGAENRSRRVAG